MVGRYLLPNHPSRRVQDRFSLLDDLEAEDGLVDLWTLLDHILRQPATSSVQIIDILDTISATLQEPSRDAGDYGTLKNIIEAHDDTFFELLWPRIVELALSLPKHFPDGYITPLQLREHHQQSRRDNIVLHRCQIASLLAHQFLCTLSCPRWRNGYFDFSIWYHSEQRHPKAVQLYLTALLTYLASLGDLAATEDPLHQVEYSLHSFKGESSLSSSNADDGNSTSNDTIDTDKDGASTSLCDFTISKVQRYTTDQQLLANQGVNGAVVVSANKDIGFGQSATQEELFMGNAPEACPAVLFTPTLADDQVLLIHGARPVFQIIGQRREIEYAVLSEEMAGKQGGRMLFMDALEIDEMDGEEGVLPDLKAEHLEREIRKAHTAFSAWSTSSSPRPAQGEPANKDEEERGNHAEGRSMSSSEIGTVWTGVWGCGAFNGDPGVKMVIVWIAASLAGRNVHLICDTLHGDFPDKFREFVDGTGRGDGVRSTVGRLRMLLEQMPRNIRRLETMDWLIANAKGS